MDQKFEDLPKEELAELLRQFHGTVLSKNGKQYNKSGLINIHSGINRHLVNSPHKKTISLMEDTEFLQANKIFTGHLWDNKEKGLDTTKPRVPTEKDDLEKLFNIYFLQGLQTGDTEVLLI